MKTNIMKIWGLSALAVALITACTPEPPVVEEVTPEFPALVENNNVLPGETLTLSFVPNLDWTVSIPQESIRWFSIVDGSFETDYISGKASETPVEVKVKVSEAEEFASSRTCEVSLTMGDETKVIAIYTRQAKARTLSVYTAHVEDEAFVFGGEDGGYLYSESEAESIDLIWPEGTNGFRMPVKVDANFAWTLNLPEWAEANIPENTVGVHTFDIIGVPSEYPLDGDEGKITFKDGDTVVKEINITIPSCKGKLDFGLDGALTSLSFNDDGEYVMSIGYEPGPAYGTVFGPQGVTILAVDKTESGYGAAESTWVHAEIADWDPSGDVLQTRQVGYSVDVNDGDAREALVFVLPATFEGTVADLFAGSDIAEEYALNYFPISQDAYSDDFITLISNKETREASGFFFEKLDAEDVPAKLGSTDYFYNVTYSVTWGLDEGWMYLDEAFDDYKFFNAKANPISPESSWLTVESSENKRSVRIAMDAEELTQGYIAFYDAYDKVLCVLECVFDPDKTSGGEDAGAVEFIGESAQYAEMVGATLTQITDGAQYDAWKEYGAPIYHLKYKVDNVPMKISLPRGTIYYMPNPYMKRDLFRVNDQNYDDQAGSFSYIDGGVDIYMSLDPENPDSLVSEGVIIFSSKRFDTTEAVTLVLICTLDMRGE